MKYRGWPQCLLGTVLAGAGGLLVVFTRAEAIRADAAAQDTLPFSLGLILLFVGLVVAVCGLLSARKPANVRTLTMAAMFAALCYVGFTFFQIKIPVGDSSTSFHLGNVFCVLAALCIGGLWGGLAGAVGMTVGDLFDPVYITSAPKTFLLKLGIGLITGFVAHRLLHISREGKRTLPLPTAAAISCAAGMLFNMAADPLAGYLYKRFLMGLPQDAAAILAKLSALTTAVNAIIAVFAATLFYLALRPVLKRTGLLPRLDEA